MDALCFEDLDEFGRDIDDPMAELYQDVIHMLLEAPGSNCDAPDRSIGLDDALGGRGDPQLKHTIERKLMDDPRIDAASATVTLVGDSKINIQLLLQADGQELGVTLEYDAAGNFVAARK